MTELIFPVLGTAVLLFLATDAFITVFHPGGHGGPLTRRQNGAVWWLWKKAAPSGDRRDGWLSFGGPSLAVLTPAVWALLLVIGFALIYYPWMERFLVSPGTLRAHWAEALYFSGFAAATLGTGDIVPDPVPLRLLSILQALAGFGLLSAGLSYIVSIYREVGRKTTLAADLALHYRAGQPGNHPARLADERERWLEEVAGELVHLIQTHAQYPILHYFRSKDRSNSLALQLGPLVMLSLEDRTAGHGAGDRPSPGSALVAEAVERYLTAADERFVRHQSAGTRDPGLEACYHRLLDYLAYSPEDAAT